MPSEWPTPGGWPLGGGGCDARTTVQRFLEVGLVAISSGSDDTRTPDDVPTLTFCNGVLAFSHLRFDAGSLDTVRSRLTRALDGGSDGVPVLVSDRVRRSLSTLMRLL